MLPPHRPQNAKVRRRLEPQKRTRPGGIDAKPLARMAFGNIRRRLKRPQSALKPSLRVLEKAQG